MSPAPMETRSIAVTFANSGIVTKSSPDELPITAYKALINVYTDQENSISVRKGFTRLNDGLLHEPYSFHYLRDETGQTYRYAIALAYLYCAPVSPVYDDFDPLVGGGSLSSASDPRAIFATYTLYGQEVKPYAFMADGTVFLKHQGGTANPVRRVGIPAPTVAAIPDPVANTQVLIDDCSAAYTDDVVTSTHPAGHSGNCVQLALGATGAGGSYKSLGTVDLGADNMDDVIELWVRFPTASDAEHCTQLIVMFNISATPADTSFTTRFEKVITPSMFELATQPGSTGRSDTYRNLVTFATGDLIAGRTTAIGGPGTPYALGFRGSLTADQRRQIDMETGVPSQLGPGYGIWNRIRIMKSEFNRVGESAITSPTLSWATITAIRFDITGDAACTVQVDEVNLNTTGHIFGTDITWTFTYYNSKTGTESDYAPVAPVRYPYANLDTFSLLLPTAPSITPPLANPDKIRIYRMGGTVTSFQFVDEVPYTAGATYLYYDDHRDSELGQVMDMDNQLCPSDVKGVELYDDRLWTWGSSDDPPNMVRFSKKVQVESFPADSYIYAGTGSEHIQRVMEFDGELFVLTINKIYRVVGSDEQTYRAVTTPFSQGLKSPHGICRGNKNIYMLSYDGIYEFPSGRKISLPINHVFLGETVNEIPPIASGTEQFVAMAFWDSKVYFSYRATDNPYITNDRTLVWDTIYERWHLYLYGAQGLFFEPDNNILIGGNLVQWTGMVDGVATGFSYSGSWPMWLEHGLVDVCSGATKGIFWAVDTKEFDLGYPDQDKRFIDFVVDADTQGFVVLLQAGFDLPGGTAPTVTYEPLGVFHTHGRDQFVIPCPTLDGDSRLARRLCLRMLATTDPTSPAAVKIYKIVHRILLEPMRHKTFVTDWADYGVASPKFFRELWIELDTYGHPLSHIEVQVDQAIAETIIANTVSTGRTKFFYGLQPDLRGTLARLKIVPGLDPSGIQWEVKLYDHGFITMPEPPCLNTQQTPYTDEQWPYNKLWKEVVLDVDTINLPVVFHFWLDGHIHQSFEVKTAHRQLITHSLEIDTIGKLGRLTVDDDFLDACGNPLCFRYYGHHYVFDKEPADVTLADSYDQLLNYDRYKILRRFWIAMKNPDCDVSMQIWADEDLKTTKTIALEYPATGFSKRRIDLESAIKGKLFRVIFRGTFPFEIYWERSEVEMKGLNSEDGYNRVRLSPPQTF